jgi:hypothetical protein
MPTHAHAIPLPVSAPALERSNAPEHAFRSNRATDAWVQPSGLLRLQRLAGNAAVASLIAGDMVQRDDTQLDKPQPGAKSIELIFILRKPNDQFTQDMTDYVKNTLKGHEYREVANIEDICAEATKLASQGITLSRVRIVGHGQTNIGGVGMTPAKEKKWRFVQPDEVKAYMKSPECKGLRGAMAKDAEVEFWGCYLGGVPQAGEAWADLFGKPVKSTKGEMKVGAQDFMISKTQAATSVKDVPKGAQKNFRKWLLRQYKLLRATGEAPFLKTDDEQVAHMKDLFDRSGGKVRSRVVQEKGNRRTHRPGEADELQIWETTKPNP